jgi:hypothetical protein
MWLLGLDRGPHAVCELAVPRGGVEVHETLVLCVTPRRDPDLRREPRRRRAFDKEAATHHASAQGSQLVPVDALRRRTLAFALIVIGRLSFRCSVLEPSVPRLEPDVDAVEEE